jgi:hypothetical protein
MKYRVSFYRKAEVVAGRAPRYMVDLEAADLDEAKAEILAEPGVTIRSAYKAPEAPIRDTPSFVFITSASRNKWYSSHKSSNKERKCHECKTGKVEHYKRICAACRTKREEAAAKPCINCKKTIPPSSRKRYCDECSTTRKVEQEKFHRDKRAKQNTVERIKEQVAWAEDQLKTVTLPHCKLSSRFQGLRLPHVDVFVPDAPDAETGVWTAPANRCRACLQKFIDVQTVYLANLLTEEQGQTDSEFLASLLLKENDNAHSHAAGV